MKENVGRGKRNGEMNQRRKEKCRKRKEEERGTEE
jgi:hypothetical protein